MVFFLLDFVNFVKKKSIGKKIKQNTEGNKYLSILIYTFWFDFTGGDYVITGSKDHTIKVFNVSDGKGGVVAPSASLEPPHYDGIESLALQNETLFSASRDTCIKKWNLRTNEVVKSLNNAHKDWICGLCFLPGGHTVISGCRAGYIKLWSTETCNLVGEMKAHNSTINTITTVN